MSSVVMLSDVGQESRASSKRHLLILLPITTFVAEKSMKINENEQIVAIIAHCKWPEKVVPRPFDPKSCQDGLNVQSCV